MSGSVLTEEDVEDIVIELLAAERGMRPAELREELEAAGADLPVDSVLMVEVLVNVEKRCGVRIPADPEAARSLRSVKEFARTIVELSREDDE